MKASLRVALAEDEPMNRKRLARLLSEAGCEIVGTFATGSAARAWLEGAPDVDAVFLDVQMPGLTGLQVLAGLDAPPLAIFVTAHAEHAVEAFDAEATDYLLKPVTAERLARALDRLRARLALRQGPFVPPAQAIPAAPARYAIKAADGLLFLDLAKTTHFEVEDEIVWAHAGGQRWKTQWTSLNDVEQAFPTAGLMRIHRHLLVRPETILGLRPSLGGRVLVRLAGGLELEASRGATPRLRARLGLG